MNVKHNLQDTIKKLIEANIPVHLIGESGAGKTTILQNIAKELNIKYSFITCTRQTGVGSILGFISATGNYIRTPFRDAYEHGHMFDINEINAMDPNTLIIFNTLDNDIMCFPDGYSKPPHPNFRLVATSNPNNQEYGARHILDFSTENRFETVLIEKDENLISELSDKQAIEDVAWLNAELKKLGVKKMFTMRDSMRLSVKRTLDLKNIDPLFMLISTQPKEVREQVKDAWKNELIKRKKKEAFERASRFEVSNFEDFVTKIEQGK
jgi:MoxR-like ATPase